MSSTQTQALAQAAFEPIHGDPNPGFLRALLHGCYDVIWWVTLALSSPWWVTRSVFDPQFRSMALERFGWRFPPNLDARSESRQRILIHGVSVGEIKGALPLVRALEAEHPELDVLVSSTTSTGLEVARNLYGEERVVRFPIDLSRSVGRFLRRLAPACVVLMELEIWPNFLRECNRAGMPVAVVNGRITAHSFGRYRLFRHTLPQFNRISLFCVQAEEYARRFDALCQDGQRVVVTGNMKADGLKLGRIDSPPGVRDMLSGRPGQSVIVAGSTHHPEERWVVEAWRAGAPDARLVLVPRHPGRASDLVRQLQAEEDVSVQLLTNLRAGEAPDPDRPAVVDTIGELESIYALADLVFVGGSLLEHGGQNVLEPAAQGRPVLHGPHVQNFSQEVALLASAGAAREVADSAALARALRELCADGAARERMGEAGLQVVQQQKGATRTTLAALSRLFAAPQRAPGLARP